MSPVRESRSQGASTELTANAAHSRRGVSLGALDAAAEKHAQGAARFTSAQANFGVPTLAPEHHGGSTGVVAPASVDRVLATNGAALEPGVRGAMENRLGHDFSQVRIHDDSAAAKSAAEVDADAYSVGNDVVFAKNRFAPATRRGDELLTHELAHVAQAADAPGSAPVLRRQPSSAPSRKGIVLSAKEVRAEAWREKLRKKSGQSEGRACRSITGKGRDACVATLEPGLPVTIVDTFGDGVWFQVLLPELPPGVSGNEPLFVPAAFIRESAAAQQASVQKPANTTNYYEFDFSADSEPGKTVLVSNPVAQRSNYIDAQLDYMVYGLYYGGFQLHLKGVDTPVFVSNRFLDGRLESVSLGDRIYDTYDEAMKAVAAASSPKDSTPWHAYYAGAEGRVIAPTVISSATTPRIMATLYAARAELARRVIGELGTLAVGMAFNKFLGVFYQKARTSFRDDPAPPKTPTGTNQQVPKLDPDAPSVPLVKDSGKLSTGTGDKPVKEPVEKGLQKLSNKKRDDGGGGRRRDKSDEADDDEQFRADERQDAAKGKKKSSRDRRQDDAHVPPAASDPDFRARVDAAVKQNLNRTGQYADVEQWQLQSMTGPHPFASSDMTMKEGRGFRYQASFRRADGSSIDVSVNYDSVGDHFGTIKQSSGKP